MTTVPLHELVDYFNHKISGEQGLSEPPLRLESRKVEGRFKGLILASEFQPVRWAISPHEIVGHDAILQTLHADGMQDIERVFHSAEISAINLDRLCRTIHMLNYLPTFQNDGYLFLHVHPRHILGLKRDHGAYFEEVIVRCGLSPRRVVITVPVTPIYDRQLSLLLEGLKNYQGRNYGTAIKFDESANEAFLERYCIEFLYRITPDFVRLDPSFFSSLFLSRETYRRKTSLLSVIHGLDTEFMVEGIEYEQDARLAEALCADLVKGGYYEPRTSVQIT